jgi:hypothetical protein
MVKSLTRGKGRSAPPSYSQNRAPGPAPEVDGTGLRGTEANIALQLGEPAQDVAMIRGAGPYLVPESGFEEALAIDGTGLLSVFVPANVEWAPIGCYHDRNSPQPPSRI